MAIVARKRTQVAAPAGAGGVSLLQPDLTRIAALVTLSLGALGLVLTIVLGTLLPTHMDWLPQAWRGADAETLPTAVLVGLIVALALEIATCAASVYLLQGRLWAHQTLLVLYMVATVGLVALGIVSMLWTTGDAIRAVMPLAAYIAILLTEIALSVGVVVLLVMASAPSTRISEATTLA